MTRKKTAPLACKMCGSTRHLAGVNGEWFCPDHFGSGLAASTAALRAALRNTRVDRR